MMIMSMGDHIGIVDPPERGRYPSRAGQPPDQKGYPDRGSPRRRYPNRDRRPPRRGGYPGGGPPNGDGGPLMAEDPLEMEDPLVDEDHQALKDPLDQ